MIGEIRLWPWELADLGLREWGLPTGRKMWRAWRTPTKGGGWLVFQFTPNPDPDLVTISRFRVVLRSGPRH